MEWFKLKRALVVGASGGIGQALVQELKQRGQNVTSLSRRADQFDITNEDSIWYAMDRLTGPFETIFVATGALAIGQSKPEKTIRALDPVAMAEQFALNATGPALVLKHALQHIPRDRRAVFLLCPRALAPSATIDLAAGIPTGRRKRH